MACLRILAGLLILTATAAAQGPERPAAAPAAIDEALRWITRNSTYRAIPLRHWITVTAEDMPAQARKLRAAGDPRMVYAMYVCASRTLYFRADADFRDPVVFSFLVHELTHHLQCETGRSDVDLCAWEREAYGIQHAYLRSVAKAGTMDGVRLSRKRLAAVQTTAADLDRRRDEACRDLQRY